MLNVPYIFEKNGASTIVGYSININQTQMVVISFIFADFMPNMSLIIKGMLQLPSIIVDYLSLLSVLPVFIFWDFEVVLLGTYTFKL